MRKLFAPPELEISGIFARAFVDNLQSIETAPILEKHGFMTLESNEWYPTHKFMDAMNELAGDTNLSSNMIAIGMEIGARFPPPPGIENPTMADALRFWNDVYQGAHRGYNGSIGDITVEQVTPTHFRTLHDHLYPDDFVYGIAYTLARQYLQPGTSFTVYYDPDLPRRDEDGSDVTVIHITWEE